MTNKLLDVYPMVSECILFFRQRSSKDHIFRCTWCARHETKPMIKGIHNAIMTDNVGFLQTIQNHKFLNVCELGLVCYDARWFTHGRSSEMVCWMGGVIFKHCRNCYSKRCCPNSTAEGFVNLGFIPTWPKHFSLVNATFQLSVIV